MKIQDNPEMGYFNVDSSGVVQVVTTVPVTQAEQIETPKNPRQIELDDPAAIVGLAGLGLVIGVLVAMKAKDDYRSGSRK